MKKWTLFIGAAAATAVVVALVVRRAQQHRELEDIPHLISDCFERIHRIEEELHRFHPDPGSLG